MYITRLVKVMFVRMASRKCIVQTLLVLSQVRGEGKGKRFVQGSMIEDEENDSDVSNSMAVQCVDMIRLHGSVGL
jgi:hypothetical protein